MKISSRIIISLLIIFLFGNCENDEIYSDVEGVEWTLFMEAYANCNDAARNESYTFVCTSTDCVTILFARGVITWTEKKNGIVNVNTSSTYIIIGTTMTVMDSGESTDFAILLSGNMLTLVGPGGDPGCTETLVMNR